MTTYADIVLEGLLTESYRFKLGKNLGRINFKAFFDNVMAQRPKLWATDNHDGNLLESDDMILRGTIGENGKSVVCDAWLATHATTYDALCDMQGGEDNGSEDFWVDDQMLVHIHIRFRDTEDGIVQLLKDLAEKWGTRLAIEREPEKPLKVVADQSKPGRFNAVNNEYAGGIQVIRGDDEMAIDSMEVRFENEGVEKALLDAAMQYAADEGCHLDLSYAPTPQIMRWIKTAQKTSAS